MKTMKSASTFRRWAVLPTCALLIVSAMSSAGASPKASDRPFVTQSALTSALNAASTTSALPANLSPSLQQVANDWDKADGCFLSYTAGPGLSPWPGATKCSRGAVKSSKTVVLLGDSQAWMWEPAFDAMGKANNVRVVMLVRASCEVADMPLWDYHTAQSSANCTSFRAAALHEIALLHPAAVVIADLKPAQPEDANKQPVSRVMYLEALAKTMATLRSVTSTIVLLGQHPILADDPTSCLSAHPGSIVGCGMKLADATTYFADATYSSVAAVTGARYQSPVKWFCGTNFCPAVVDGGPCLYR